MPKPLELTGARWAAAHLLLALINFLQSWPSFYQCSLWDSSAHGKCLKEESTKLCALFKEETKLGNLHLKPGRSKGPQVLTPWAKEELGSCSQRQATITLASLPSR